MCFNCWKKCNKSIDFVDELTVKLHHIAAILFKSSVKGRQYDIVRKADFPAAIIIEDYRVPLPFSQERVQTVFTFNHILNGHFPVGEPPHHQSRCREGYVDGPANVGPAELRMGTGVNHEDLPIVLVAVGPQLISEPFA